uniref:Patatin like phospholipase domain containing 1 n=1 Tax=Meleagris gallopavo TaxID=9103 RepID=A0A803XNM6_MELGA
MYSDNRSTPFSLSFSGSGFLALYQVGVVQSLLELAPELLKSACKVYGSSAGSLIAAAVVCGISLGKEMGENGLGGEARKTLLGPLSPKCSLLANLRAVLQRRLPEDSYQVASGRLHISLTRVVDGQNVMVSEFSSNEELIQALLCSCFLPIYCGFIPPSYRGVRYVDGGFTGLQPVSSLEEAVITVSPFTGELDICPRDCPAIFYCFQIFNGSIQISVENLCRISYALFPPSTMVSQPGPLPFALIICWYELPREVRGSPSLEGLKTNVALRDVLNSGAAPTLIFWWVGGRSGTELTLLEYPQRISASVAGNHQMLTVLPDRPSQPTHPNSLGQILLSLARRALR